MECDRGIFKYKEKLPLTQQRLLPPCWQLDNDGFTLEGLLIKILLGQVKISDKYRSINQSMNFSSLPYSAATKTYASINQCFEGMDIIDNSDKINRYLNLNRRNHGTHDLLVSELSCYFTTCDMSPIAAFNHLYRCFEFISYSFPMIYASKSNDYRGTFKELQTFSDVILILR